MNIPKQNKKRKCSINSHWRKKKEMYASSHSSWPWKQVKVMKASTNRPKAPYSIPPHSVCMPYLRWVWENIWTKYHAIISVNKTPLIWVQNIRQSMNHTGKQVWSGLIQWLPWYDHRGLLGFKNQLSIYLVSIWQSDKLNHYRTPI